ncbi:unnamed protein product [Trichogramma brassicae]|uniref:Uncharacterized protein n=1 Tax=Trichogramma brassicae TaxID=86971 RepID=A0A6H5J7C1_9HYME|nr:unnamed protein product [Trichogramma brassicae]
MTMVEGRPMVTVIMPTLAVTPTVVRPMAVTPTMPTLTVTPTVVVRPMAVTPTTPTLAVTATVVRPMAVTPTTPTLTVTPTVTVLRPSTDASNTTHEHEAFSIGYYIKCSFDESQSVYRSYRMTNEDQMSPAAWFVHELSSIANRLEAIYKAPKKMIITEEQQEEFEKTSTCYICNRVSSRRGQPAKYHRFQSFYIRVFDNCDAQVYLLLPAPFLTPAGSSTLFKSRPVSRIARYNLKWPVSRSPCSDGSPSCGGASSTSSCNLEIERRTADDTLRQAALERVRSKDASLKPRSWIFNPPFHQDQLNEDTRLLNDHASYWHGLSWDSGEVDYERVGDILHLQVNKKINTTTTVKNVMKIRIAGTRRSRRTHHLDASLIGAEFFEWLSNLFFLAAWVMPLRHRSVAVSLYVFARSQEFRAH